MKDGDRMLFGSFCTDERMSVSSARAVGRRMLMVSVCTEFTETDEITEIARHE
jgi:hypothetical protein